MLLLQESDQHSGAHHDKQHKREQEQNKAATEVVDIVSPIDSGDDNPSAFHALGGGNVSSHPSEGF
jgi:hypothetical protein